MKDFKYSTELAPIKNHSQRTNLKPCLCAKLGRAAVAGFGFLQSEVSDKVATKNLSQSTTKKALPSNDEGWVYPGRKEQHGEDTYLGEDAFFQSVSDRNEYASISSERSRRWAS